jgi:cellulase/cellobiase CelA1
VINLMEALRRSVAEEKNSPPCAGKWSRRANGRECHGAARGNEPSLTRQGLSAHERTR